MLSIELILEARDMLQGHIVQTPVEFSPGLSERCGRSVWLKLDNLQVTGSFKYRGAVFGLSKLKTLGADQIATCSAGNHGRAVAKAAKDLGMRATIYVPAGVDRTKYDGMVAEGARVIVSDYIGYDDTETWALSEIEQSGIPFLSAYDDEMVMAGNGGTVALEVSEQVPDASLFVMPAGGGGHAAGFAFAMNHLKSSPTFVLCQHADSQALRLSLEGGNAVREMPAIDTLAAGIEGGFGEHTFEVIRHLNPIVTHVTEREIREGVLWMLENHQYVIEGSSAVAVAAAMKNTFAAPDGTMVVFISGRNLSLDTLKGLVCA